MRVGIAVAQVPFLRDGGQIRAEELVQALRCAGHEAEIVRVPYNGLPEYRLAEQMLACRLLDLEESMGTRIDRLISLTFPAYLMPHPAQTIWLLRQCRDAYDLWGTPHGTLHAAANGEELRTLVRDADAAMIPRARSVFVPSHSAAERLRADCRISGTPLLAPPWAAERYHHIVDDDFFLVPVPDGSPFREELVLQAMQRARHPIRVRMLAGSAGKRNRVAEEVLGGNLIRSTATIVERPELFGTCLAVILTSLAEWDGIATLEAMLSEKPAITCADAGAAAELVYDGQTGFVCAPDPEVLAGVLDRLWEDRNLARRLGRAAHESYQNLGLRWDIVVERLLA